MSALAPACNWSFCRRRISRIYLENFRDVPVAQPVERTRERVAAVLQARLRRCAGRSFRLVSCCRPCCWPLQPPYPHHFARTGAVSPDPLRSGRAPLHAVQVSLHDQQRRAVAGRAAPAQRTRRPGVQDQRRPAHHAGRPAGCAASASTSCRNSGTSSAATCRSSGRVRRFPTKSAIRGWQRRRLRMRPGLTCIWVLEGRSHCRVQSLDPARPGLHRQLVAVARRARSSSAPFPS